MYDFECHVCGTEFKMPVYGDGKCPNCGVEYEYDEGQRLVWNKHAVAAIVQRYGEITARLDKAEEQA